MTEKETVTRRNFIKYAGTGIIIAAAAIGGGYYYYSRKVPGAPRGEPLKIASPMPLTGPYAYYGVEMMQGLEIAADELNAKGGILGRPVEFILRDSELTPAVATRRTMELIEREHVEFIVGSLGSQVNFALNEISKREKIPFMVCNTTETTMHTKETLSPYAAFPPCVNQAGAYANTAITVDKLGPKHYNLAADYVFGHEFGAMTEDAVKRFGGELVGSELFPVGTTDFSAMLRKAREAKPDVLVVIAGGSDQVNCVKQIIEFGMQEEMGVIVPVTTTSIAYAAGGAEAFQGIYVGTDWYYKIGEMNVPYATKAKELNDRFMARFGRPGDAYSCGCYVGMMEICKAAERAGTTNADEVIEELKGHEFEYHKGPEYWRPCDRQAIQNWFVVRGLPPEQTKAEFDFFEIVDVKGYDDPDIYFASCEDLGY